ncbi:MAG TPA: PilT/PilU family type 4a pilus ATPase [Kofleriaceae bacterium]|jgi:twitching motility protein PilT|nr:PilT/PilU family type 4a pilus ATPase [Kofleriaceae bacterium]
MSAIQSLLRVMTLRDAEAIILEADKVPSLRRRGQIEKLAMPALEAQLLADFTGPLLAGRSLDDGPVSVAFHEPGGAHYQVTLEKLATGLRVVVRPGKPPAAPAPAAPAPAAAAPASPPARSTAWWAQPTADRAAPAAIAPGPNAPASDACAPGEPGSISTSISASISASVARSADGVARLARLLAPLVDVARERGASDVIASSAGVWLRVAGQLEAAELTCDEAELVACVAAVGSSTDHSLELDGARLRVNAFDHLGGAGVVARLIRDRVPGLTELALPAEIGAVVDQRDGLVLVAGPTGSGKSTTLAALIDLVDQRRAAHVITLEDPIEYRFTSRRGVVHQREVGRHIASFAAGLRSALREAPDVILLGELRDRETIAAALTAAETGHLVLATLHAPSAAGAIDRIIDAFPETQQRQARWQLASVLRTVITQYLLPRRDGGRVPAIELVPITTAVANLMRKGDLQMLPSAIQTGRDAGMIPLERSLARLLETGAVSPQVVKAIAADHDLLAALASRLR